MNKMPEDFFNYLLNLSNEELYEVIFSVWNNSELYTNLYAEYHPLGFIKIELTPIIDRSSVSLHIWTKNVVTPIHNHHFDLKSKVIVGEIYDKLFQLKEDELGEYRQVCVGYNDVKRTRLLEVMNDNKFSIDNYFSRKIMEGDLYKIKKNILHNAFTHDFAMTLVYRYNIAEHKSYTVSKNFSSLSIRENYLRQNEVLNIMQKYKDNICI